LLADPHLRRIAGQTLPAALTAGCSTPRRVA
jgi:hypothetical protein